MTVNEMKWICVMPPDENEVRKFIHDTSLIDIILRHLSMRFDEFSPESRVIVEMRNFLSDLASLMKLSETKTYTKDLYMLRYMSFFLENCATSPDNVAVYPNRRTEKKSLDP